jgi:hypothetical protein
LPFAPTLAIGRLTRNADVPIAMADIVMPCSPWAAQTA